VSDDGAALLDLGGVSHLFGGDHQAWAGQLRADLRQATGLDDVRIALAASRGAAELLARVRPEIPLFVCPDGDDGAALGSISLDQVPWLARQSRDKLDRYHLRTLSDVRRFPRTFLKLHFGETGERLAALAAGLEAEPEASSTRSLAEELVLPRDEVDFAVARERVHELADRLSFALRERGLAAREIRLRLCWSDGQELSSMIRSARPCEGFLELRDAAWSLLSELSTRRVALRALRLSASRTEPLAVQQDLFAAPAREEQQRLGIALDAVRRRQGFQAVRNALSIAA
jgi:DNA polymerase-4